MTHVYQQWRATVVPHDYGHVMGCFACQGDNIIGRVIRGIHNRELSIRLQRDAGLSGDDWLTQAIRLKMLLSAATVQGVQ